MRKLFAAAVLIMLGPAASALAGMSAPLQAATSTSYEGFVAFGPQILEVLDSSDTDVMCRMTMQATDNLTSIKVVFSNFMGNVASPGDLGNGSAATQTAAIEYPSGTIDAQLTFGGSTSGTIPNAKALISDYATLATPIPKGSYFWVRNYQTNPNGVYYTGQNASWLGDQCNTGTTDQTMSTGSITGGTSQTWSQSPLAVIAHTLRPSVLVIGDSRTAAGNPLQNPTIGNVATSLFNAGVGYGSIAVAGALATQWLEFATARSVLYPYGSQVIIALGINDIDAGVTASSVISAIQNIWSAVTPPVKSLITIEPRTTSTDGWTTLANQTNDACLTQPCASPDQRIVLNDTIRSGIAGATSYYEMADVTESSRDSTFWAVDARYGYTAPYTSDGLHPLFTNGYKMEAASGVIVVNPTVP